MRRFAGHRPGPEELVDSVAVDAIEVLKAEAGDESAVSVAVCLDLQRVDRGEVSGGEGRECDADASNNLFHGVFPFCPGGLSVGVFPFDGFIIHGLTMDCNRRNRQRLNHVFRQFVHG